jgi:hypothetical protein
MHAIKHLAIRSEDDGLTEVRGEDASGVIDDRADCGRTTPKPTVLIDLLDLGDSHVFDRQPLRSTPDRLYVPGALTERNPVARCSVRVHRLILTRPHPPSRDIRICRRAGDPGSRIAGGYDFPYWFKSAGFAGAPQLRAALARRPR